MDSPQTGKMHGDGFCVLGETATSQATAFMSGIAANIRNQNPSRTKDQVIAMLRRDAYKSSEYTDNAQGRNEWTGRGIVQPGKTMKENIFPEIKTSINKKDNKYYFTVSNWPADYTIEGE